MSRTFDRIRRRLYPAPGLFAALMVASLLLSGSLSWAALLQAALLAWAIPIAIQVRRDEGRRGRAGRALRLVATVLFDIGRANVDVARRVLGPAHRRQSGWIQVPLALRSPTAQAVLAQIVALTPGTIAAAFSEDRRHLLVHALHVDDPKTAADTIRTRYQAPLTAIFEP